MTHHPWTHHLCFPILRTSSYKPNTYPSCDPSNLPTHLPTYLLTHLVNPMPFLLIALLHCQSCLPMQSFLSSHELHVRCVAITKLAPPRVNLPSSCSTYMSPLPNSNTYVFLVFFSTQMLTKNSTLLLSFGGGGVCRHHLILFFSFCCLMMELTTNNLLIVVIFYSIFLGCLLQ